MSDDVRLDLELAADAEIDRQLQNPQPIMLSSSNTMTASQIVSWGLCTDGRVPNGVFEARCIARGFRAAFIAENHNVYFMR